jgi:hypothetical protein
MFRIMDLLFGCSHRHCTFPITSRNTGLNSSPQTKMGGTGFASPGTYIVCLDCGKEFRYDWQQMKVGKAANSAA